MPRPRILGSNLIAALLFVGAPALAAPSLNPADAPAGHYELDPAHASLIARVRHMGLSNYTLRFDRIAASYDYDPAHPTASKVTASIDAHSLDVGDKGVSARFADLFLGSDTHPAITFTSTDITTTDADHGTLTGDLTFNGVTRPVTLDLTYDGTEAGLIGGRRMGFSATGTIQRSAFGSTALKGAVGDEVELVLELEFKRK